MSGPAARWLVTGSAGQLERRRLVFLQIARDADQRDSMRLQILEILFQRSHRTIAHPGDGPFGMARTNGRRAVRLRGSACTRIQRREERESDADRGLETSKTAHYHQYMTFFDYVDRRVEEAEDGSVDRTTLRPTGYDPFYGAGGFVSAMWRTYRRKADDIGAATLQKAALRHFSPGKEPLTRR